MSILGAIGCVPKPSSVTVLAPRANDIPPATLKCGTACEDNQSSNTPASWSIDLGMLQNGAEISHVFEIENTSQEAFTVTSVSKSCYCHELSDVVGTTVSPSSVLEVRFVLPSMPGGAKSGLTVVRTDSASKLFQEIPLKLQAVTPKLVWAKPAVLRFSHSEVGNVQRMTIQSSLSGFLDSFRDFATSRQLVSVDLVRQAPGILEFDVRLDKPLLDSPATQDFLVLQFDDLRNPIITIRVGGALVAPSTSPASNSKLRG